MNIDNKPQLDKFFKLAKNEKVVFSQENTIDILNKFSSIPRMGFWASLFNKIFVKYRLISLISLTSLSSLFFLVNSSDEKSTKNEEIKHNSISYTSDNLEAKKSNIDVNENNNPRYFSSINNDKSEDSDKNFNQQNYVKTISSNQDFNDFDSKSNLLFENSTTFETNSSDLNNANNSLSKIENKNEYNSIINDFQYDGIRTLAFDFAEHNGFSISFKNGFSNFGNKMENIAGIKAVWIINKKFSIGLSGNGIFNPIDKSFHDLNNNQADGKMVMGYGGILFDYNFNPENFINFSLNAVFGGGGFNYKNSTLNPKPWGAFVFAEPGASLGFNLNKYFKVGLDVSYIISDKVQKNYDFTNDDTYTQLNLEGLSAGISFKIGLF